MIDNTLKDAAVFPPLIISLTITLSTVVIHGLALVTIVHYLRREQKLARLGIAFWRDVSIAASVTMIMVMAHLADVTLWAIVLCRCGEFVRFGNAFYHSAMNYTSLGYGDLVMSASWKLLGPLETADGMLMFGVSTATIFAVIERMVQSRYFSPSGGTPSA